MEYLFLLAAIPALFVAFVRLQIARRIEDMPTSPIGSAEQGLVEIKARTVDLNDMPLTVPRLGIPCVWYRYESEDKGRENGRVITDARESFRRFYVADSTGICAIDPLRAEIHPKKVKLFQEGSTVYKLSWIGFNEALYILGWLHRLYPRPKTDDEFDHHSNTRDDVQTVVKRYGHLKANFDHITHAPLPGIPYVISAHYEHALIKKLKRQSVFWLAGFFIALVILFIIIKNWRYLLLILN